jgi:outer membrane biosynthesis protein TonB
MNTFDPNSFLNAADEADQTQLIELEKEVAVLGGQVMQQIRDVVESIRKDDKAPVVTQIRNAQNAKLALTRANGLLREPPQERRSSERRPERQRQQSAAPAEPTPPAAPADPPAPQVATPEPQPVTEPMAKKKADKRQKKNPPAKKAAAPSVPAPKQQPTKKADPSPAKKAASASSAPAKKAAATPAPTPPTIGARFKAAAKKALANLD